MRDGPAFCRTGGCDSARNEEADVQPEFTSVQTGRRRVTSLSSHCRHLPYISARSGLTEPGSAYHCPVKLQKSAWQSGIGSSTLTGPDDGGDGIGVLTLPVIVSGRRLFERGSWIGSLTATPSLSSRVGLGSEGLVLSSASLRLPIQGRLLSAVAPARSRSNRSRLGPDLNAPQA